MSLIIRMLYILVLIVCLLGQSEADSGRMSALTNPDWRVANIKLASAFEYTFMVAIVKNSEAGENSEALHCGGAIVHVEWVLTAARCFAGEDLKNFAIFAGVINIHHTVGTQIRSLQEIVRHPQFNPKSDEHNLALLKISEPFKPTHYVDIGKLPSTDFDFEDTQPCHILGFGKVVDKMEEVETVSERLLKIQLSAVNFEECSDRLNSRSLKTKYTITEKNYCLVQVDRFPFNNSQGACNGDDGGPCICKFEIRGIIAHNTDDTCRPHGTPTIVVDVGVHLDWIRRTMLDLKVVKGLGRVNAASVMYAPVWLLILNFLLFFIQF